MYGRMNLEKTNRTLKLVPNGISNDDLVKVPAEHLKYYMHKALYMPGRIEAIILKPANRPIDQELLKGNPKWYVHKKDRIPGLEEPIDTILDKFRDDVKNKKNVREGLNEIVDKMYKTKSKVVMKNTLTCINTLVNNYFSKPDELLEIVSSEKDDLVSHTTNMIAYMIAYGLKNNLKSAETIFLGYGAMVHDIGKVRLNEYPEIIPLLDPKERSRIESHPMVGYLRLKKAGLDMIKNSKGETLPEMALYHHKKENNEGYPVKLSVKKVPKSAQIIGMIDLYDFYVNKPKTITSEEALERMAKGTNEELYNALCKTVSVEKEYKIAV